MKTSSQNFRKQFHGTGPRINIVYSALCHNRNNVVLKIHFSNKEDGKLKVRDWSLSEKGEL